MTPPSQPTISVEDRDTALAASVRLVRLRRRAGWTAIAGFVAFLVAISAYSNQYSDATDSGPAAVLAVAMVLGALTIFGLVTAVVCTVLLGRRTAAQRARALAAARSAGRSGQRQSRRGGLVIASGVLLVALGAAALFLPGLVNGVAYLAGGHTVTFVPQSHDISCSYHGTGACSTVTVGILETGGAGVQSTWPDDVPLDQPFQVREPVWTWGIGAALIDGDGIAVGAALISLLFDGLAVLAIVYAVGEIRSRLTKTPG